jgi:hypothetical protein
MTNLSMLKEPEIKAAFIDWLIDKNMLADDAVLINELPVDDFSRRVDLAIANGKLLAFEIKSDFDNLSRLEGQISTYLQHFDKVTLVCSTKFTDKAMELLPKNVEIIEFASQQNRVKFSIRNRGKLSKVSNNENFLSFVDKRQLVKKLREHKIACSEANSRTELYRISELLSSTKMRNIALSYLKSKYRRTHLAFSENRGVKTSPKDLEKLSKNKTVYGTNIPVLAEERIDNLQLDTKCQSGIDITENLLKLGVVSNYRITILPRKTC